ncbi:hypothetical protein BKI52_39625 [marine bacterium AO1-C]|nr:hypothetical protein BKI52_39625 [marine bacterium AO1-C]
MLKQSVLNVLMYYDIFHYPLTIEEIFKSCDQKCSRAQVECIVEELVDDKIIFRFEKFYSLHNKLDLILRRLDGNQRADRYLKIAHLFIKIIASFPFVRAIFVSGSVSKNYADKNSDVDFFVIAAPNKVWILKVMLVLFKKTFLLNHNKFFCANYLIDSDHLTISNKNIYTSLEIVTLIPVYGKSYCQKFYEENEWVKDFYPNYPLPSLEQVPKSRRRSGKFIMEMLLSNKLGNKLDDLMLKLVTKYWKIKHGKNYKSQDDYQAAITNTKQTSRAHWRNFHKSVFVDLETKKEAFRNTSLVD